MIYFHIYSSILNVCKVKGDKIVTCLQFNIKLKLHYLCSTSLGADPHKNVENTPGTRGWSRLRDRTLAVQKISFFFRKKIKITFFLDIPSRYSF